MNIEDISSMGAVSHLEEKFSVKKISENVYEGKYPLESFMEGARGTYGGEFIAQSIIAAWETVEDPGFTPNSMHSYFVRAGNCDSVMRYEVLRSNDGRNFANRTVQCYQSATNQLCFTLIISFAKNNSAKEKAIAYENDTTGKITPQFGFQSSPQYFLKKYRDHLNKLPYFQHTNENLQHILPKEFIDTKLTATIFNRKEPGDRKLGVFVRVNDDLTLAKNATKTKFASLGFASDSFWLSTIIRVLGLPVSGKYLNFFRVSLDHSIWFHDKDFDPTEWMFMDFKFTRLENDRLLAHCQVFTLEGVCVATVTQEALAFIPKNLLDKFPSKSKL